MNLYDQYKIDGKNPKPPINQNGLQVVCLGTCGETTTAADGYCSECWIEAMQSETQEKP